MDWPVVAWLLFGLLFVGYFILEGFDYGAGLLLPFIGRRDDARHAVLNAMAPLWEGHEVWLITAGAVLFAAFPAVYATMFSSLYLLLAVLLLTLVVRGVAFALRSKDNAPAWRRGFDWAVFTGSAAPALLWGMPPWPWACPWTPAAAISARCWICSVPMPFSAVCCGPRSLRCMAPPSWR